jgi:hypothetical protein
MADDRSEPARVKGLWRRRRTASDAFKVSFDLKTIRGRLGAFLAVRRGLDGGPGEG